MTLEIRRSLRRRPLDRQRPSPNSVPAGSVSPKGCEGFVSRNARSIPLGGLEPADFFLEELLDAVLGHEHGGHRRGEAARRLGAGESFEGRQAERLPGRRGDPALDAADGDLHQLAVQRLLESTPEVGPGFEGFEPVDHPAVRPPTSAGQGVAPGVLGDGLEPAPEASGRVVSEIGELLGQPGQDVLGHVFGVGPLEPPFPAPTADHRAIAPDESFPGPGVLGGAAEGLQERDRGPGIRPFRHRHASGTVPGITSVILMTPTVTVEERSVKTFARRHFPK